VCDRSKKKKRRMNERREQRKTAGTNLVKKTLTGMEKGKIWTRECPKRVMENTRSKALDHKDRYVPPLKDWKTGDQKNEYMGEGMEKNVAIVLEKHRVQVRKLRLSLGSPCNKSMPRPSLRRNGKRKGKKKIKRGCSETKRAGKKLAAQSQGNGAVIKNSHIQIDSRQQQRRPNGVQREEDSIGLVQLEGNGGDLREVRISVGGGTHGLNTRANSRPIPQGRACMEEEKSPEHVGEQRTLKSKTLGGGRKK